MKLKKKKLFLTDPNSFQHVTVNTHIFLFGLIKMLYPPQNAQ